MAGVKEEIIPAFSAQGNTGTRIEPRREAPPSARLRLAVAHKAARITIAICVYRRGGADGFTSHTSPHGDQPQPLIQGGAIFRRLATIPETTAWGFRDEGLYRIAVAHAAKKI
jgi:hypothetical protein